MKFSNWQLIGLEAHQRFLQKQLRSNTMANSYLIYGLQGLQKRSLRDVFVNSILCESEVERPCLQCAQCKAVQSSVHPDYRLLDFDLTSPVGIEHIRLAMTDFFTKPLMSSAKVLSVNDFDKVSINASNAILKHLEEPPPHSHLILLADNLRNVPGTVISRCQLIKVSPVLKSDIVTWLNKQSIPAEKLEKIVSIAGGNIGRVSDILYAGSDYEQRADSAENLLAATTLQRLQLIEQILSMSNTEDQITLQYLHHSNGKRLLHDLQAFLRTLVLLKTNPELLPTVMKSNSIQALSTKYTLKVIIATQLRIARLLYNMRKSTNIHLAIENAILYI